MRLFIWGYRLYPVYLLAMSLAYVGLLSNLDRWTRVWNAVVDWNWTDDLLAQAVIIVGLLGAVMLTGAIGLAVHRGKPYALKLARVAYLPLVPSLLMVGWVASWKPEGQPLLYVGLFGSVFAIFLSVGAWLERVEAEVWGTAGSAATAKDEARTSLPLRLLSYAAAAVVIGPVIALAGWGFHANFWALRVRESEAMQHRIIASYPSPATHGWKLVQLESGDAARLIDADVFPGHDWGTEVEITTQRVRRTAWVEELVSIERSTPRWTGEYDLSGLTARHLSVVRESFGAFVYQGRDVDFECVHETDCDRLLELSRNSHYQADLRMRHGAGEYEMERVLAVTLHRGDAPKPVVPTIVPPDVDAPAVPSGEFQLTAADEHWVVTRQVDDAARWAVAASAPWECATELSPGVTQQYLEVELGDVEGKSAALQFRPDSVWFVHRVDKCVLELEVTDHLMQAGDSGSTDAKGWQQWEDGEWTLETGAEKTANDHFELRPVPGGAEIANATGEVVVRPTLAPTPGEWGCLRNDVAVAGSDNGPTALIYEADYEEPCDPGKAGDWITYDAREVWVETAAGWEQRHYATVKPTLSDPIEWRGPVLRWRAHREVWTDTEDWEPSKNKNDDCGYEIAKYQHHTRWQVALRDGPWVDLGESREARDWRDAECQSHPDEP